MAVILGQEQQISGWLVTLLCLTITRCPVILTPVAEFLRACSFRQSNNETWAERRKSSGYNSKSTSIKENFSQIACMSYDQTVTSLPVHQEIDMLRRCLLEANVMITRLWRTPMVLNFASLNLVCVLGDKNDVERVSNVLSATSNDLLIEEPGDVQYHLCLCTLICCS